MRNDTEPSLDFESALRSSDDTCSYRVISPPAVSNATTRNSYLFNEARRLWSLIVNYTCDNGFELVSEDHRYMFCRSYRWWAPITPKCRKGDSFTNTFFYILLMHSSRNLVTTLALVPRINSADL